LELKLLFFFFDHIFGTYAHLKRDEQSLYLDFDETARKITSLNGIPKITKDNLPDYPVCKRYSYSVEFEDPCSIQNLKVVLKWFYEYKS